jgi:hypothetical protein
LALSVRRISPWVRATEAIRRSGRARVFPSEGPFPAQEARLFGDGPRDVVVFEAVEQGDRCSALLRPHAGEDLRDRDRGAGQEVPVLDEALENLGLSRSASARTGVSRRYVLIDACV